MCDSLRVDKNIGNVAWVQLSQFVQKLFWYINNGLIYRFRTKTKGVSFFHWKWAAFFFSLQPCFIMAPFRPRPIVVNSSLMFV